MRSVDLTIPHIRIPDVSIYGRTESAFRAVSKLMTVYGDVIIACRFTETITNELGLPYHGHPNQWWNADKL